ncbi:hypothetical protein [Streptomyces sp. NPDC046909]|uniref:beta family protein n=1 Tax=Streptomyces sp. NPDC046909 TaxID=3155617 RepID=UPI0033D83ACE
MTSSLIARATDNAAKRARERDAWEAYEQLDLDVRRRIAPLWTIVPRTGLERTRGERGALDLGPGDDQAELNSWLTPRMDRLIEAMADGPGRLDAAHVEGNVHGCAVSLRRLITRSRLRLVTGPERHPALQRYAADLAFLSRRGMGIRVLVGAPPDEPMSTGLLSLLDRLCLPPSLTDLILDMGAVTDPGEAGKTAVAALDVLGTLVPWRTVVLTAGAFPRVYDSPAREPFYVSGRHDWQLHGAVRAARPTFQAAVVYGDYSAEHVFSANVPHVRPQGPPWGVMRYTAPDGFLLGRVPTRGGRDRADRVRAMARRITESAVFRGADYGDGERWLQECADGEGVKGSGNAETWIKVGHSQHLNFVVHQLMGAEE